MSNTETAQVSSLPLPPTQYMNLYSDENVRKNRTPKPPQIQNNCDYSMFGNVFKHDDSIIRPLEAQGFKRLYPQHFDKRKELKKLNHSLFINFLDLLDYIILYPESPKRTEKIDDLNLLFVHIHHLLNEFRPHQGRETLRVIMEVQKRQRVETAQRFQKHLEKVRDIVKSAFAALPDQSETDSKLIIPGVHQDAKNQMKNGDDSEDTTGINPLDRLMCNIIDKM